MAYIPPPDVVALVRRLYQEGATVNAIVAASGIKNLNIIYRCLDGRYPDGSGVAPARLPRRKPRRPRAPSRGQPRGAGHADVARGRAAGRGNRGPAGDRRS